MSATPIPVTPELIISNPCGGPGTWDGVPKDGVTYRQWADAPGTVIIAQPDPGHYLVIPEGSPFGMPVGDAAGAAWTGDIFSADTCTEVTAPTPDAPPLEELPATGADSLVLFLLGLALVTVGVVALIQHGRRMPR